MDPLHSCTPCPPLYLPPYTPQLPPFYLPTFIYQYTFSTDFFPHPNVPIHIVYQPCPLTPHFRFFESFLAIPLLPVPSPTTTHLLPLFSNALYFLPDLS
jgi:hypothetical protein